jgi:hypothetical protein
VDTLQEELKTSIAWTAWKIIGEVNVPKDAETLTEFANFHQAYVLQHIQMADAKAGVVIAISGALLGFLASEPGFSKVVGVGSLPSIISAIALILLALSFAFAFSVVRPRGGKPSGVLYFAAVAEFESAVAYRERIEHISKLELADARVEQCYAMSRVCADKYVALRRSMITGVLGALSSGAAVRLLAS